MTPQPEPTPFPTPPANWSNIPDVVTFVVAAVFFVLGILTSAGVVLPAHTAADVSLWAGIAQQAGAIVASVVVVLSRHSVQKAQLAAAK